MTPWVGLLLGVVALANTDPVFDVPRMDGIVVDGRAGDWKDGGFRVLTMSGAEDVSASSLDGRFRIAWDAKGLLVLVGVKDDAWKEATALDSLYSADSTELFVTTSRDKGQYYQVMVAPGMADGQPNLRFQLVDKRSDARLKSSALAFEAARTPTPGGYLLEARLPWANLGVTPRDGLELGFQLYVNDRDGDDASRQLRWFPAAGAHANPARMNRVRLATSPSPAVAFVTRLDYPGFRSTRVLVTGPAENIGQTVTFRRGSTVVSGPLVARNGRSSALIAAPIPNRAEPNPTVLQSGTVLQPVTAPDFDTVARAAVESLSLDFGGFVFRGTQLPKPVFRDPDLAQVLLGGYQLSTVYYGPTAEPVTEAKVDGRYGAVVTITPVVGTPIVRYVTLYRRPDGPPMWQSPTGLSAFLPKELGLDPAVVETQSAFVGTQLAAILEFYNDKMPELAMLLAGFSETKATDPMVERLSADRRDQRYWFQVRKKQGNVETYPYFVTVPKEYEANPTKAYPTILFLHGAGERGNNLDTLRGVGLPPAAAADPNFPFILIAPQCPEEQYWNPSALIELLDQVRAKYRIDPKRLYLTGLSMGGYGSWALAAERPDLFAAVAPICGGYDIQDARQLRDTPIWAFHGEADPTVPLEGSVSMVDALRRAGSSEARLTTYPGVGHNSWDKAYGTAELYQWFLAHVKP